MITPATELPDELECYKSTDTFDEKSIPAALMKDHSTKAGVWGRIVVESGKLCYRVTDPRRTLTERVLLANRAPGVVEPTVLHHVAPLGPVRFRVEFLRASRSSPSAEPVD
jgi:tellurite resistance-related uncharacterized protein